MLALLAIAAALLPTAVQPAPPEASRATGIEPVPYTAVTLGGAFWSPRLMSVREGTLQANRHQCEITGRIANFENAAKKLHPELGKPGDYQGYLFNDSDVYKMMQGWACLIATEPDAAKRKALDAELDALIAKVAAAQLPDGYIDTYYTLKAGLENRFTREEWDHETYCMGHLIEAGAEHFRATGKRNLVDVAVKAADFLRGLYGPEKFTAPPGHEELELALIALAESGAIDATKAAAYAGLAKELIEYRGKPHRRLDGTTYGPWGDYAQDHKPAAAQLEVAGHAVRAGYLYSGMADVALWGRRHGAGNDPSGLSGGEYVPALKALWDDVTQRRIFVTGGIGPSGSNEGFTVPYDIPTRSAYQETCASIAVCLWAHRMFLLTGEAKYMEQFERTLYNAALAGVSLDGKQFFYVNPLACAQGAHARRDWFDCACCPPNVLRFFAGLGRYVYAVDAGGSRPTIYVNLIAAGHATLKLRGKPVELTQETDYPRGGKITIRVDSLADDAFELAVRADVAGDLPGAEVRRDGFMSVRVPPGQRSIEWTIPMEPRRVYADPRVKASVGKVAIMRGPLVYAAESVDNRWSPEVKGNNGSSVGDFVFPAGGVIREAPGPDGVAALTLEGLRAESGPGAGSLYRNSAELKPAQLVLRPYFMWANRGPSEMRVWLPETPQMLDPRPPKGTHLSASFVGHGDGLLAVMDRIVGEKSNDETVPRLTFWPHKGKAGDAPDESSMEWVECRFDHPETVSRTAVFWFDDTGVGECRVPRGVGLEYLDGETWKPVAPAAGSKHEGIDVIKDQWNVGEFTPVVTKGLRLRVWLREKMSAGILEWRVDR